MMETSFSKFEVIVNRADPINYFTEKEKIIRALAVRDKNLPLVTINQIVRFLFITQIVR